MLYSIRAQNKEHLKKLIEDQMATHGHRCDLNHIDVSLITDMSELFHNSRFNGDISQWDTREVVNMQKIFQHGVFNGDISKWNVGKVIDMSLMFMGSTFNQDISAWNVASVENMEWMFAACNFNGDISKWDVSNVVKMNAMFYNGTFNGDISQWNTQRVQAIQCIFFNTPFKGDISQWELSSLVTHENAFHQFHDSPLGYMGVLEGRYAVPNDFGCAARFNELRSLCDGLKMDALSAAQYIYQEVRQPAHFDDVDFNLGVYELLV